MLHEPPAEGQRSAVLLSGGLDSAVLVLDEARTGAVQPVYIETGLAWEAREREATRRLLSSPSYVGRALPLVTLSIPMSDVYPATHWALRGTPPAYDTPDEDVYLSGRNIILLAKAGTYCAQHRIPRIVLGPLEGNPFPDATPEFFRTMASALSLGLARPIEIATPYASLHKEDVIRLGQALGVPFELTLSCMNPVEGRHCGLCSKCRERRDGFGAAGVPDPTLYANSSPRAGR
jgi:7-cyano-7-deazaguanine synthase